MRKIHAVIKTNAEIKFCRDSSDRLEDIGVSDGTTFHLYPIEDEKFPPTEACAAAG